MEKVNEEITKLQNDIIEGVKEEKIDAVNLFMALPAVNELKKNATDEQREAVKQLNSVIEVIVITE